MDDNSTSQNISQDMTDKLELDSNIPHKMKLLNPNIKSYYNNNFINATIHCLTNIKGFIRDIYSSANVVENGQIFYNMITSIYEDIKEKKEKYDPESFHKQILIKLHIFEDKTLREPRVLIEYIFNNLLIVDREIYSEVLSYVDSSNIQLNSFSLNISNLEKKNFEPDKTKYNIKKIRICSNQDCKAESYFYKAFKLLKFYLNDKNKEYSIYDCFLDFLKNESKKTEYKCSHCSKNSDSESKTSFFFLPDYLILLIYYGKDNNCQDFYYKIEDELDFTDKDYIDAKIPNKKYILWSIIFCKFPKEEEKEIFYTYVIKDKNYIVYNNNDIREHEIKSNGIKHLKKLKTSDFNKERSFPYVLIYTAIKK